MPSWPAIAAPEYPIPEKKFKPQVRTEFEGNYVQGRPRSTRSRLQWTLTWGLLSETEFQLLDAFFDDNQGGSFTWTHPVTTVQYSVRFSADSLDSEIVHSGWRKVTCPIEQV